MHFYWTECKKFRATKLTIAWASARAWCDAILPAHWSTCDSVSMQRVTRDTGQIHDSLIFFKGPLHGSAAPRSRGLVRIDPHRRGSADRDRTDLAAMDGTERG